MIVFGVDQTKAFYSVLDVATGAVSYSDGTPSYPADNRQAGWDYALSEASGLGYRSVWIVPGTYCEVA